MRTGTQYTGTVNRRNSLRVFTHSWPQNWHVIWYVVPVSPRAGAPQLEWSVEVERANTEHATYWVNVRNLTDFDAQFEMRYAIMNI